MTKEKLKQEAEEWIAKNSKEFITNLNYSPFDYAEAIYLASAEPREKRIAELEQQNKRYKEMCEDMKADMCGTDNKVLCDYLIRILKKYGEIV